MRLEFNGELNRVFDDPVMIDEVCKAFGITDPLARTAPELRVSGAGTPEDPLHVFACFYVGEQRRSEWIAIL
ncbi:hypothetical protein [Sulfobacillus sp. hq2]|uniref:hypothetical protein n=1 Tax=Sulfobacillus TaxID=28033 RepID=UPI000CD04221|nr:hypothetical protein [Sulfobacillus sp. hq2]POB12320.1 hypothetical protein CO251_00185 [Sulfobacillus sp. hq2]